MEEGLYSPIHMIICRQYMGTEKCSVSSYITNLIPKPFLSNKTQKCWIRCKKHSFKCTAAYKKGEILRAKNEGNWKPERISADILAVPAQLANLINIWVSALTSIRGLMKPWTCKRQQVGIKSTSSHTCHEGVTQGGWHPQWKWSQ